MIARTPEQIIDISERFLSALWQALTGCPVASTVTDAPDVPVDAMPTAEHRAVMQALIGFAENDIRPTERLLRHVASRLEFTGIEKLGRNQHNLDLIDRLPLLECTSAGLPAYARIVNREYRRRQRIARLWRKLGVSDSDGNPLPGANLAPTIRIYRRKRGAA